MLAHSERGDVTALFSCALHPLWRDGFREGKETRSHRNFESRPWVCCRSLANFRRSGKSALGCLKYSRIWCLSREKHHRLWLESVKGIELRKSGGASWLPIILPRRGEPRLYGKDQAVARGLFSGPALDTGRPKTAGAPCPGAREGAARGT